MNISPALGAVAPPTELGVNTSNLCFVPAEGLFVSPRSGAFVSGERWDSKSRGGDGAAAGGAASRPRPLPTRTGAAGPSRSRFSWSRVAPRTVLRGLRGLCAR